MRRREGGRTPNSLRLGRNRRHDKEGRADEMLKKELAHTEWDRGECGASGRPWPPPLRRRGWVSSDETKSLAPGLSQGLESLETVRWACACTPTGGWGQCLVSSQCSLRQTMGGDGKTWTTRPRIKWATMLVCLLICHVPSSHHRLLHPPWAWVLTHESGA